MLRNYWKIAWRSAVKNKLTTSINLIGLTVGLTCCLLITVYVVDELTYDRFHHNADRIVLFQQNENSAVSGGKFATDLKSRFAQIVNTVRLTQVKPLITRKQTSFYESGFWFADSSALSIFSFPLVRGNARTALAERDGVVLSETMARKYFGDTNPLGQSLRLDNKLTLHVTGVLRDLPANSHLHVSFLANNASVNTVMGYDVMTNYWGGTATQTYFLLAPNTDLNALKGQFPAYIRQLGDPNAGVWQLNLIPLTDIYLRTNLVAANRLTYVYVFAIIALLILGLACFNYVNLATARATQRAKEVGIRKALGSSFGQLWRQFMSETTVFIGLAVLLTVALLLVALPAFNDLTGKQLRADSLLTSTKLGWLVVSLSVVALVAGSYPAFVLSSFQAISVLNGIGARFGGAMWLRKTLVVSQFAVSVGMIVATLVVYSQRQFIQSKNVGYQREQILTMDLRDATNQEKERFKQLTAALPGVEAATRAFGLPGSGAVRGEKLVSDYVPKGSQTGGIIRLTADGDFLKTFGIKLIAGRNLDASRPADKQAFLVNRAAMKLFGWQTIVGKKTGYYSYAYDAANPGAYHEVPQRGDVVGVIDDYNHADLKQVVAPMLISLNDGWEGQLGVRIRANALPTTIRQIEQLWRSQFPGKPFSYEFLDDTFNRTYQAEARTGYVFSLFAGLAVLISCLGLFGLAMFAAEQRTKEIGVRKVLGASVVSIVALLSTDFLKLVIVAIVVASPVAWYAMNRWLNDFAYKIDIGWWVFALAGALAIGIALLTVSFQSIKAALMNPVKSLRSE